MLSKRLEKWEASSAMLRAARKAALFSVALMAGASVQAQPHGAYAGRAGHPVPPPIAVQVTRPRAPRRILVAPQVSPTDLLHHMVKANLAHAFTAREVTLNLNGQETEQWVRWDPKQGLRRDSIRPAAGDILIDNFKTSYVFSAHDKRWVQQNSLLPRPSGRINEVLRSIKIGDLRAELVGQDMVAGRVADIVRVLPVMDGPAPTRKFWVDRATGLRLKSEDIGPAGRTLSTSYYLSVEIDPRLDPRAFDPPVTTANAPLVVEVTRFRSIEDARTAGIKVHQPDYLPMGFALRGVEVGGKNRDRITQRYNNGLTLVSVVASVQRPFDKKKMQPLGPSETGFMEGPRGLRAYVWHDAPNGLYFTVLSSLPDDQIKRIADSVH